MNKLSIYILGLISGVILTFAVGYLYINRADSNEVPGLTLFEKDGECISKKKQIKIFQVVKQNAALAHLGDGRYDDLLILIINSEGKTYYDDQTITIHKSKCAKQIGTYSYESKMEVVKTVPVVIID